VSELGASRLAIERLEKLKLPAGDRVDVLLVMLGEKPATAITFSSSVTSEGEEPISINESNYSAYMDAVSDAGLLVEVSPDEIVNPSEELFRGTEGALWAESPDRAQLRNEPPLQQTRRTVFLAKTPENLALVKEAQVKHDYRLYGKAYGFPETSTEAYSQHQAVSARSRPNRAGICRIWSLPGPRRGRARNRQALGRSRKNRQP
jgi:hypothetical protein